MHQINDSIWFTTDQMTKSAYFLPINTIDSTEDYDRLYLQELVKLYEVILTITSNMRTQFTSQFWKSFLKGLGTHVHHSITFYLQTDDQAEWTIQALKDMLRACMINFKGSWDYYLPLIDLAYNNIFHSNIKIPPFDVL